MFDDIFKGTDFGDIKDKKVEEQEDQIVADAARKGVWHTGQKPDIWAVDAEDDDLWDVDDLDDKQPSKNTSSPGIFDDIF